MSAQIVTGEFCSSYFATYQVPGSKPGQTWAVWLHGTEAGCSCPAFKFFKGDPWDRTCKHLEYVWANACLWNEQWRTPSHPITLRPDRLDGYPTIPGSCCRYCQAPTCPVKIAV